MRRLYENRDPLPFESPGVDDRAAMESVARSLTDDLRSVRVFGHRGTPRLAGRRVRHADRAEYQAVGAIDREIRLCVGNWMDSAIGFPRSEAEQRQAERKNAAPPGAKRWRPGTT